jgi:hypothetical protein
LVNDPIAAEQRSNVRLDRHAHIGSLRLAMLQ